MLDGAKMWCSYAHKASHILIVCRTGEGERHEDMSMILVPHDAEGFTITPIKTLGGEETNELHLDGVRVPEEALLGTEGGGWIAADGGPQLRARDPRRHGARAGPAHVRRRARLRQGAQAVRPPGRQLPGASRTSSPTWPPTSPRSRLLVRWVARLTDEDPARMLPQEASMAKLAATELAKRCALEGVQIMGGYGYATEYPMERHLRAAVVTTIYGGTSEIQKNIIAKTLGL